LKRAGQGKGINKGERQRTLEPAIKNASPCTLERERSGEKGDWDRRKNQGVVLEQFAKQPLRSIKKSKISKKTSERNQRKATM